MEKFTINNFKLFDDNFEFDTPPITILTGKNNSGKSSFIKALLFFDEYNHNLNQLVFDFTAKKISKHKINNFENAKNWHKGNTFSLSQKIKNEFECTYQFIKDKKSTTRLKKFHLQVINSSISMTIEFKINRSKGTNYKIIYSEDIMNYAKLLLKINHLEFEAKLKEKEFQKTIVDPTIDAKDVSELLAKNKKLLSLDNTYKHSKKLLKNIREDEQIIFETRKKYNDFVSTGGKKKRIIEIQSESEERGFKRLWDMLGTKIMEDYKKNRQDNVNSTEYKESNTLALLAIFLKLNTRIHHLSPNRTKQERIYLKNYENTEIEVEIAKFERNIHTTDFMQSWLEIFEIGTDIRIGDIEGIASTLGIVSENIGKKKITNIVDLGFGTGQILTILLKIANTINEIKKTKNIKNKPLFINEHRHIIIIEEPETNLHPSLQSYLANLFIEVNKMYGIRFIIETHSEYLIRSIQLLVAENYYEFNRNDAIIYYMENSKNQVKVKKISINENGSLSDRFGKGFLDEAADKAIRLMEIKNKFSKI